MAETLGSLCDKLTILQLKKWHAQDPEQTQTILIQEKLLQEEITEYVQSAATGFIPVERLAPPTQKVYKKEGNDFPEFHGNIGEAFSQLALVNCKLWHQQEKVYEFEKVPLEEKDSVVKNLAVLNLERNQCMDEINAKFYALVVQRLERNRGSDCDAFDL